VQLREETQRHINATISSLEGEFVCVLAWGRGGRGGGKDMSRGLSTVEMGRLLEALAHKVGPEEPLYLAVDGLSAAHLDAIRILFPYATAFDLYPWLNQAQIPKSSFYSDLRQ